jgi:ATP-binding cassette subfamily B protein
VEEEVLGKAYDGRLMRRLLVYLRPYRRAVIVSLVLLLLLSVLQVVGPLLTGLAVDRYLAAKRTFTVLDPWLPANPWTGILEISLVYLTALVLIFVLDFSQSYLMQWTGQQAMFDLRRDLMAHLQRLDLAFYDRTPVGRVLTRITTDVDALNELLASGLVTILADLLMLGFVFAAMLRMDAPLTGVLAAIVPVVIAVTVVFRRSASQSYRRIRVAIARINAYLQEHLTGMTVLQLFNRERKSAEEFEKINRIHMEAFKDAIVAYAWFFPVLEFLSMLGLAAVLTYGGFRISVGKASAGTLVTFFLFGMRIFRPIQDLSEKYNLLQSATAASERIFGLLDTPVEIVAPAASRTFPAGPQPVEFDHVWFAYKGEDWVLRDVTFSIRPGETIAVVGHTGAGKTTLISTLLRFYDVARGAIRVGGVDIRELDPADLRRHFGVVLQDPHLFSGTIGGNIQLGTDWITPENMAAAAEQVNLLEFIESLPNGFAEPVRERGGGLSTGQKQLISFARALAHNPPFLILHEATSSVDTETEMRVREALNSLVEGRTSIVIAHRLSTIQRADRILVMHKGRLRESGTHQELLAFRGIYWKLYQLQYKDQESAPRVEAEARPEPAAG